MLIVADSSALIALSTCQALDILLRVYDDLKVPRAVYNEVIEPTKPQAIALSTFLKGRIIDVDTTHFVFGAGHLGQGEIEAMLLYKELAADVLLIDDRRARAIAEHNQINCIGALGVLLLAKHQGIIEKVKPYLDILRNSPIHYGDNLLSKVLQLTGE